MKRLPFIFTILILILSPLMVFISQNLIELFLLAELISIAFIYVFFSVIIPAIFPRVSIPDSIFLGGAAKPPYIYPNEVYSPQLPLIQGKIDQTWAEYFDAKKYKSIDKGEE